MNVNSNFGKKNGVCDNNILFKIPNIDYSTHPAYGKLFGCSTLQKRYYALRRFLPPFLLCLKSHLWNYHYRRSTISYSSRSMSFLLKQFVSNGVVATKLSFNEKAVIAEKIKHFILILKEKRQRIPVQERGFIENMLYIREPEAPELYNQLRQIIKKYHLSEIARFYLGRAVDLQKVALHIYDSTDRFLYNNFYDAKFPDTNTTYMHIDGGFSNMVKCLIYLNKVNKNNGPFSYVIGSNNLKVSLLESAIRSANSFSGLYQCSRSERELFWALPKVFQKKAEFGNDLLDSSPESAALIKMEHQFTSEDGDLIFFDNEGIHRGGLMREGERQVIELQLYSR